MPATWDIVQEKRLLLAIIDLTNPKAPQWPLVAEKMGDTFSSEACRQHYQKIRRASAVAAAGPPKGNLTPKANLTPTKAVNKRKLSSAMVNVIDDDSEPESEEQCKKMKKEDNLTKGLLFKIKDEGHGDKDASIDLDDTDNRRKFPIVTSTKFYYFNIGGYRKLPQV